MPDRYIFLALFSISHNYPRLLHLLPFSVELRPFSVELELFKPQYAPFDSPNFLLLAFIYSPHSNYGIAYCCHCFEKNVSSVHSETHFALLCVKKYSRTVTLKTSDSNT
ncbi:hypothetical protein MTR_7g109425 [Medicago truncatula]|uniref:Uncharacterized protein n=1 Tax=Medicago truncatula TaxID=3880 RepID=A0A072U5N1_MEDTR|nr:hypothetical protein MTR_7g109425 [Medicago truncatula]